MSFDYFVQKRSDILLTRGTVPMLSGISGRLPTMNLGKTENKGWEFELTYNKNINKDLFVMLKGNVSYNKNRVLFFGTKPFMPKITTTVIVRPASR